MLSKIGKTLSKTREEKGLSVDEVSNILNIRKQYIMAIEGKISESFLPPDVYIKGYIKMYAKLLKLEI